MEKQEIGSRSGDSEILNNKQAYAAMCFFIKDMFNTTGAEELRYILSSLQLLEDGTPADGTVEFRWRKAVIRALDGGAAPSLKFH